MIDGITANLRRQRSALTRAQKTGDPDEVMAAAERALRSFDIHGWPDQWSDFQRARDDAATAANFSLNGGVTVQGAALNPVSQSTITLTTTPPAVATEAQ